MRYLLRYSVFLCLIFFTVNAQSETLKEGNVYRLQKTVHLNPITNASAENCIAVKESKFEVIDSSNAKNPDYYVVRFITLYSFGNVKSTVKRDEEYLLSKMIDGVPIEKSTSLSFSGMVSGPLIVPFKYRFNDNSLTGESTLGYYAGFSFEPRISWWSDTRIPVTPFISGGLAQVSIASDVNETSNQTGISLAAGILVQNWAGVNIGLIYGQDRIGNNNWKHEGEGWVSFMIGLNLN